MSFATLLMSIAATTSNARPDSEIFIGEHNVYDITIGMENVQGIGK